MAENVLVSVVSHQYADGDVQRSETKAQGQADKTEKGFSVSFGDDLGEGTVTECNLLYNGETLTVERSGAVRTVLRIREGEKINCAYNTVFGEFSMRVTGKNITFRRFPQRDELLAYYYIDFGSSGDVLNKVKITIWYGDIENEQNCKNRGESAS